MAYVEESTRSRRVGSDATLVAGEWRRLRRAATAVALFTSPLFFVVLYDRLKLPLGWALLATVGSVIAFRGLVDVVCRKLLPWPSMYGVERSIAEEDVVAFGLRREWTRIGRSLAADIRFDDPTVSRRHALIVRQPDGLRVLDDRSLNGVFVNDQRVRQATLDHGDRVRAVVPCAESMTPSKPETESARASAAGV